MDVKEKIFHNERFFIEKMNTVCIALGCLITSKPSQGYC
jgi:hypothetical protein